MFCLLANNRILKTTKSENSTVNIFIFKYDKFDSPLELKNSDTLPLHYLIESSRVQNHMWFWYHLRTIIHGRRRGSPG